MKTYDPNPTLLKAVGLSFQFMSFRVLLMKNLSFGIMLLTSAIIVSGKQPIHALIYLQIGLVLLVQFGAHYIGVREYFAYQFMMQHKRDLENIGNKFKDLYIDNDF